MSQFWAHRSIHGDEAFKNQRFLITSLLLITTSVLFLLASTVITHSSQITVLFAAFTYGLNLLIVIPFVTNGLLMNKITYPTIYIDPKNFFIGSR